MAKQKQKKDEPTPLPHETLGEASIRWLAESLRRSAEGNPEEKELERLRELCRKGNPFPLIAKQWPELVLTDPEEIKLFASHRTEERFAKATDGIRKAVFDPSNPPLRLDWWQYYALAAVFDETIAEIGEKGATKVGKGASTSIAINLWFDVWPECKIVLTSQRAKHAQDVIFGETLKWYKKMQFRRGRETTEGIKDTSTHYVTIANPESGEGFSGQHGPRTLFVFDEASSVPDGFYDDAGKQARKILALANPRYLTGWFRGLYKPCDNQDVTQIVNGPFGKRLCMTIDGAECMNVMEKRLEKPVGPPGGITIDGHFYDQNAVIEAKHFQAVYPLIPEQCDYGRHMGIRMHPDPNHVAVMAHGHFAKEDAQRQIILGSWLERHTEAHRRNSDSIIVDCFGLDVSRSKDGDETCLAAGGKAGCQAIHKWQYDDTTYHAKRVIQIAREVYKIDLSLKTVPVCVDTDGLGAGTTDRLKEFGVWVIEFRGGLPSEFDNSTYGNRRAEGYGMLGRRLNPDDVWQSEPWMLPYDTKMFEELTAPEKVFQGGDALKFKISPKNPTPGKEGLGVVSVKEKIGRSPDTADAVVYLYWAVRFKHKLDAWLQSVQGRELLCYPSKPAELAAVKKVIDEAPKPKTEWDDISFEWSEPKPEGEQQERKIVVAQPDKYPRRPWYERYLKD